MKAFAQAIARPRQRDRLVERDASRRSGQQDDAVGERERLVDVVGNEQHGRPIAPEDVEQMILLRLAGQRVERAERLVHQQELGPRHQRPGERGALRHAARQLLRQRVGERGETDALDRRAHARGALDHGHVPQAETDIARDGEPRHQARLLEHHRDLVTGSVDRPAVEQRAAAVRPVEAGEQAQEGALAAAARAEHGDQLALGDR